MLSRVRWYSLLTVIVAAVLVFFSAWDTSYLVYGVTTDVVQAKAPMVPIAEYQTTGDNGAVVLMYHHIVPDDQVGSSANSGNNAVIGESQFAEEMAYLARNGYHTLLMSEVNTILQGGLSFPEKSVVITFDDGYASNYTLAYPILDKYDLKATIAAVMVSTVDASETDGDIRQNIPHLTFDQMREMQDSGLIEFGSHSYDGHGLIDIDALGRQGKFFVSRQYMKNLGRFETVDEFRERIANDLRYSKYVIEQAIGKPVIYFAYPYGASGSDVRDVLQRYGFAVAVTTVKGTIDADSDRLKLNRRNVDQNITLDEFAELLNID